MKQKAIGGYFSLELPYNEYGRDGLRRLVDNGFRALKT